MQKEFAPIIEEMWKKFPKLKVLFLWLYQSLPGVSNSHVQKQVNCYMKQKALPILKKHRNSLEKIPGKVLEKLLQKPRVKKTFQKLVNRLLQDKKLLKLLTDVAKDIYKRNEKELLECIQTKILYYFTKDKEFKSKLKKCFEKIWNLFREKWKTPELQNMFAEISGDLDTCIGEIVNSIVLKKNRTEISAGLAAVLRRQVFFKDRYCLYVTACTSKTAYPSKRFSGKEE